MNTLKREGNRAESYQWEASDSSKERPWKHPIHTCQISLTHYKRNDHTWWTHSHSTPRDLPPQGALLPLAVLSTWTMDRRVEVEQNYAHRLHKQCL